VTLRLILMRHAKSDWGSPLLSDYERPLNERGRKSAKAMGNWLHQQRCRPDLTLCSDAQRTQETCARVGLGGDKQFTRDLYLASPIEMMHVLHTAGSLPTVMMIGHNPGIAELASLVLSQPVPHPRFHDYPTCATLVAEFDANNWAEISLGQGKAVDFAIPREIMAN
jgi:phosphohistidine phosphatase